MPTNTASNTETTPSGFADNRLRALVAIPVAMLAVGIGAFFVAASEPAALIAWGICSKQSPNCVA